MIMGDTFWAYWPAADYGSEGEVASIENDVPFVDPDSRNAAVKVYRDTASGHSVRRRVTGMTGALPGQLHLKSLHRILQHANFAFFYVLQHTIHAQYIFCRAFLFGACRGDGQGGSSAHGHKATDEQRQTGGVLKRTQSMQRTPHGKSAHDQCGTGRFERAKAQG